MCLHEENGSHTDPSEDSCHPQTARPIFPLHQGKVWKSEDWIISDCIYCCRDAVETGGKEIRQRQTTRYK